MLASALLAMPAMAHAEWFLFPFAAVNTGGDTTRDSAALGGSFGWIGSWLGVEGEATVSPSFFDDDNSFRSRRRATTYTGTALVAPRTFGQVRPYVAAGLGILRSNIEEVGGLSLLSDDRAAMHAGGGVMWTPHKHLGLRADARYIRALDDEEPDGNVFEVRLADFNYWRIGGGVSLKW